MGMKTGLEKTIGVGLVGCGSIAHTHAAAIAALAAQQAVRLVAVLGRTEAAAQAFAERHAVPFATADADAFFARPEMALVSIVTPSGLHLEPALRAIRAGKAVLIEKPLEITLDRVDAVLSAAEAAGVCVEGVFQARFAAGAQRLKAAVDAGRFGRLALCSAYVKWHRPAAYYTGWKGTRAIDGGGVVINQSIHALDLLQWLVGMPAEVFAWKTRCVHQGIECEDTASASFRFAHGALGAFEASTAAFPGWGRRIELCGEYGSAAIEDERIVRWDFRDAAPEDAAILAEAAASAGGGGGSTPVIGCEGHRLQLAAVLDALRHGTPMPVGGREARKAVSLVRAIYASAEAGRPVTPA